MSKSYETHKYAEIFPAMASDEFDELVKDVKQNGLLEPITTLEGKVLDGRARLRACIETGITPRFVEFDGRQDPLMFVWARNFVRRHLDLKQRVLLALTFKDMVAAAAKERMSKGGKISASARNGQGVPNVAPLDETETGKTVDKLAEMARVGHSTMQSALMVEREAPELLAEIGTGKLSVHAAAKKVREGKTSKGVAKPKADWKRVVADVERLNADLSAFEVSGGIPETIDFPNLKLLAERIIAYLKPFDKGNGN